jgi:hypothetical protein
MEVQKAISREFLRDALRKEKGTQMLPKLIDAGEYVMEEIG